MSSKILFLGASPQQLGPLHYSRDAGYRVITCDNVPANPGHALADVSYDVSTTDFEGVLEIATRERVDAVVCCGSDVGTPTAAYVNEKMGLPGNPLNSVTTLTHKLKFRRYQAEQGLLSPGCAHFASSQPMPPEEMIAHAGKSVTFPAMVKPVDASGGKGISRVDQAHALPQAVTRALEHSLSGVAIVEDFVPRRDYQICGEGFLQDGRITFCAFANEHFTEGFTVPVGETFPCMFEDHLVEKATGVLQDIMTDLNMRIGAFNFDLFFTPDDEVFVVEIGPRSGGNRIPEAIRFAYGIDLIAASVEFALGRPTPLDGERSGYYATYSVHSREDGVLRAIHFDEFIESRIVDRLMFVTKGAKVHRFDAGSHMLGNLILRFDAYEEMLTALDHMERHIQVLV